MKKNILSILITILALCTCMFTLTACGKNETNFNINFIVDGEVYSTLTVGGAKIIEMPQNPTKEGDVFDGWFWDKDVWEKPFSVNSLLDSPLSSEMNVYCKWKSNTATSHKGVIFNSLFVDGHNVYGKVSNSMENFSFVNEITTTANVSYEVSLDENGTQKVEDKIVPLNIGYNAVYVTEMVYGEPVYIYTIILYRRNLYEVIFNTDGGEIIESQMVEEDSLVEVPTEPKKAGYTFDGWNFNLATPITDNLTITAKWVINTNTPYKIEYYLQNVENDNYSLSTAYSSNETGETNTTVSIEQPIEIHHFTFNSSHEENLLSGNIAGDGSLILKMYYTRNVYTLSVDNSMAGSITGAGSYKYGETTNVFTQIEAINVGYNFLGWYSENQLLTKSLSYVFDNNKSVVAKFAVKEEMQNFEFTSTTSTCSITKVIDRTVTAIVVPDYVTSIKEGVFEGCYSLNSITIPFVGLEKEGKNKTRFGYIFGTSNSTFSRFEIPTTLQNVVITGGTHIAEKAFYYCTMLVNITLPSTLISIGDDAFYNCSALEEMILPNSVNSIGESAFESCELLKRVVMPNNITSINKRTFSYCSSLSSITLKNTGITTIAEGAFVQCSSLRGVTIPNTVTTIGASAFAASGLSSMTIPSSVTKIGFSAFSVCSSLSSITLPFIGAEKDGTTNTHFGYIFGAINYDENGGCVPTSLKTVTIIDTTNIKECAFIGCNSIENIKIPNSVTSFGHSAFQACGALKEIEIPNTITEINSRLFSGCSSLSKVVIPNSVTSIASSAFSDCTALQEIELPSSITSIGSSAFSNSGLRSIEIPSGVTAINWGVFYRCRWLSSVKIPNSITSIDDRAFSDCCLYEIEIPSSVTSIGLNAFSNCNSLTSITIPFVGAEKGGTTNTHFGYIFGASNYNENKDYVPNTLKTVKITNVKEIGIYAFSGCSSLQNVELPKDLITIGNGAFKNCGLTSIEIPYTMTTIGWNLFANCNFTSVKIPNNIEYIDSDAFSGCSNLKEVSLPNKIQELSMHVFSDCINLESIEIPSSVTNIGYGAFNNCRSLKSIEIPEGVTNISDRAFYKCASLTNVSMPNSIIRIGAEAFLYCNKLTYNEKDNAYYLGNAINPYACLMAATKSTIKFVTINKDCKVIANNAFNNCRSLESIEIPEGVLTIEDLAFSECTRLTSVSIPNSITTIGENVFYDCRSLEYNIKDNVKYLGNNTNPYLYLCGVVDTTIQTVTIESGCKIIGMYAFDKCSLIETIEIPDGVIEIGKCAFRKCTSLTSIFIPNSVVIIGEYVFDYCDSLNVYCEAKYGQVSWDFWLINYPIIWDYKATN